MLDRTEYTATLALECWSSQALPIHGRLHLSSYGINACGWTMLGRSRRVGRRVASPAIGVALSFTTHASLRALLLGAIGCQAEDPRCADPTPLLVASGAASGFEKCADGAINRVTSATFDPTNSGEACRGDEPSGGCLTDADCSAGTNGRCVHRVGFEGIPFCNCEYACATEADCPTGSVCVPPEFGSGTSYPRCVEAACRGGSDCASGECGLVDFFDGCSQITELRCRNAEVDACRGDGDCVHLGAGASCDNERGGGAFTCVRQSCIIGRPLLVAGAPRVAPTVRRADWRRVTRPSEAS